MKVFNIFAATAVAAGLCFASAASAQMNGGQMNAGATGKRVPTLIFLSPAELDPALTLPRPAEPDSVEGKAELDQVRKAVGAATPAQLAMAAKDDGDEHASYLADTIPGFDLAKLPLTKKLFDDVRNEESIEATVFKRHFARLRPYELDPGITTCVPSKPTAPGRIPSSYPSGHATMGYSAAVIAAHLMPERAEAIFARAKQYAYERVICGVHFPSDTAASETLGTVVSYELLGNPDFMKEFDAARRELVAAGLTR